jgi:hypothetical protein
MKLLLRLTAASLICFGTTAGISAPRQTNASHQPQASGTSTEGSMPIPNCPVGSKLCAETL